MWCLLWGVVAERAEHLGGVEPRSGVGGLVGEVEVPDLGLVSVEHEYITGPHVAVHDGRAHLLVEVLEPARGTERDPGALPPREHGPGGLLTSSRGGCRRASPWPRTGTPRSGC
jgi:hypothetical protein